VFRTTLPPPLQSTAKKKKKNKVFPHFLPTNHPLKTFPFSLPPSFEYTPPPHSTAPPVRAPGGISLKCALLLSLRGSDEDQLWNETAALNDGSFTQLKEELIELELHTQEELASQADENAALRDKYAATCHLHGRTHSWHRVRTLR
jgi:hypothetical protein